MNLHQQGTILHQFFILISRLGSHKRQEKFQKHDFLSFSWVFAGTQMKTIIKQHTDSGTGTLRPKSGKEF